MGEVFVDLGTDGDGNSVVIQADGTELIIKDVHIVEGVEDTHVSVTVFDVNEQAGVRDVIIS